MPYFRLKIQGLSLFIAGCLHQSHKRERERLCVCGLFMDLGIGLCLFLGGLFSADPELFCSPQYTQLLRIFRFYFILFLPFYFHFHKLLSDRNFFFSLLYSPSVPGHDDDKKVNFFFLIF